MSEAAALTKPRIISTLCRSPHGALTEYLPVAVQAAAEDPEFYAHLVAWDATHGQIRDAHVALPVAGLAPQAMVALLAFPAAEEYLENLLAHLAQLRPREFLQAVSFWRDQQAGKGLRRRLVARYLRELESDERWFDRVAVLHHATLRRLYAVHHVKPSAHANAVVLQGQAPAGSVYEAVRLLKTRDAGQIAADIRAWRLPFLVALGALEERAKEAPVLRALVGALSQTDLVNFATTLQNLGVTAAANPDIHAAYLEAVKKPRADAKPRATHKAARAASAVTDVAVKAALAARQEQAAAPSVDGDWLVLADKSGSMTVGIETGRQVAAVLARAVAGKVHLVFVDAAPRYFDATGRSFAEVQELTRGVVAGGGTNYSSALRYLQEKGISVDGVAVVGDGEDDGNFAEAFKEYGRRLGVDPALYFYRTSGSGEPFRASATLASLEMQEFDVEGVDYHSLPNVVLTMRKGRYQLVDDIYAAPLRALDDVLAHTRGMAVLAQTQTRPCSLTQ